MESETLYIIIPAYNEEANLRKVLNQWYPVVKMHDGNGRSRLYVIDDGSKDGTAAILRGYKEQHSLMDFLSRTNKGHGPTVREGYETALHCGADYIFQTDSDGQTLPEEFERFWDVKNQYSLVIGHRKGRQDGVLRVFVTKALRFVLWLKFHVKITDANTPYRLMDRESLMRLLPLVEEMDALANVSLSVCYAKSNYKVISKPITFHQRQGGVNSINFKKIFKIGRKAWKDFGSLKQRIKENL